MGLRHRVGPRPVRTPAGHVRRVLDLDGVRVIGLGFAFALHFAPGSPAGRGTPRTGGDERAVALPARAQGFDEEDLRQFVAKFSGRHWEGLFEALFGYEAKLAARAALVRGGSSGPREKFAAWREPILNAIDRIERVRKEGGNAGCWRRWNGARLLAEGAAQAEADRQARRLPTP